MKLKPYPKYNDSGIQWIGEIPEGWEVRKLKFFTNERKDKQKNINDALYIGLEHIESWTGKIIEFGKSEDIEGDALEFKKNDVLFGKLRPYLAKVANPKEEGICSSELIVYVPMAQVDSKYLQYRLLSKSYIDLVDSLTYGAKMPRADPTTLSNIKMQLPPTKEQIQIARFLDKKTSKIDKTIQKDKQLIELLKEKRKALINNAVTKGLDPDAKMRDSGIDWIGNIPEGWKARKLKHLLYKKPQYGANSEPEVNENKQDIRYVRITDIDSLGNLRKDSLAYLSKDDARGFKLEEGDILFARSGATVGKVYYYTSKDGECCYAGYLIRYVTNRKLLNPKFLYYYSLSKMYEGWINLILIQSTIENVSAEKYNNLVLSVPPIQEQNAISSCLDKATSKIDKTIQKIEKKIEFLEEYKKSLIHYVITGKIDVRSVAA